MRRVGVLIPVSGRPDFWNAYLAAFRQRLQALGWTEGRDFQVDVHLTDEDVGHIGPAAAALVAASPDVIFVTTNPAVAIVTRSTRTIPIVFASISDAVGSGYVASFAHPGGNATGFQNFEPAIAVKWLEVLKEIAPAVRHVAVVHDSANPTNVAFVREAERASGVSGVTVSAAGLREATDVDTVLRAAAKQPNTGLIVVPTPITAAGRDAIVSLAAELALPTMYPFTFYTDAGGLVAYTFDRMEQVREAASYVNRILRGAKPAELPVQLPTRYELVINLKTARALGLTVPPSLLARADAVIQ
jgi:putative ABC transport system substrate-binding protein